VRDAYIHTNVGKIGINNFICLGKYQSHYMFKTFTSLPRLIARNISTQSIPTTSVILQYTCYSSFYTWYFILGYPNYLNKNYHSKYLMIDLMNLWTIVYSLLAAML
jgi:hypothetical protein